jgi:hypothetical protein
VRSRDHPLLSAPIHPPQHTPQRTPPHANHDYLPATFLHAALSSLTPKRLSSASTGRPATRQPGRHPPPTTTNPTESLI